MLRKQPSQHDRFFRAAMQQKRVAREFFEKHLPPKVLETVDLNALESTKETFIEETLRGLLTDVLFKVPFAGKTGYVYLLVEHKSVAEKFIAFKLLQYIVAIMSHHLKVTGADKLPLVYPMVLYHGKKPFTACLDLLDLIDAPRALSEIVWLRPYTLIDLNRYSDQDLKNRVWLGVMEMLLKHIFDPEILGTFLELIPSLKQIEEETDGLEFLMHALRYIFSSGESLDFGKIIEAASREHAPKTGAAAMTIAEQLKREGKREGIRVGKREGIRVGKREGIREGRKETAVTLLKMGSTPDFVAQATGFSLEEVKALQGKALGD